MKIDITSLCFGFKIEKDNDSGTPAWATSIGQAPAGVCYIDTKRDGLNDIIYGMMYKSHSDFENLKDHDVPGLEKREEPRGDRERMMFSVFENVYVNNINVNGIYTLSYEREDSPSHKNRLHICYAKYLTYKGHSNKMTLLEMAKVLGCGEDACWFVTDISIRNQKDLYFTAIVVNPNHYMAYKDSKARKREWESLLPEQPAQGFDNTCLALQQIFYGAPGTGKSHTINEITEQQPKENVYRTTFHPDSDYSTFVGCYKPTKVKTRKQQRMNLSLEDLAKELGSYYSNEELGKISGIQKFCYEYYPYIDGEYMSVNVTKLLELAGIPKDYNVEINKYVKFCHLFPKQDPTKITYEFVPQSFTKAYIRAWQTEEPVYLVIEEINRGNCAQIFGDLFQLLDRKNGVSEYPIKADNDLALYIAEKLSDSTRTDIPKLIKNGEELMLPSNLYIWATMNTSDQSLFPIDSAFKRRWEWKYVPIAQGYDKETGALLDWNIKIGNKTYNWWKFLQAINQHIGDITHSEDKKLGYFFCKAENDIISAETFVGKVLFYLWNDVYKDYDHSPAFFRDENGKLIEFSEYYKQDDKYNTIPNDTLIQTFIEKVEPAFKTIVADANTD